MKRSILFVLIVALIVSVIFVLPIGAAAEPNLNVAAATLTLENDIKIQYLVENTAGVKMLVWKTAKADGDYTYGSEGATVVNPLGGTVNNGSKSYVQFTMPGLYAKQMTDDMFVRAFVDNGDGTYTYGDVFKYSILKYAYNKLGYTGNNPTTDENLRNLLVGMLEYGKLSQVYFGYELDRPANGAFYEVLVNGGLIVNDGCTDGLYAEGAEITLTAEATNAAGDIFSHWTKDGVTVSTDREYTVTVGNSNTVYAAVYKVTNVNITVPEEVPESFESEVTYNFAEGAFVLPATRLSESLTLAGCGANATQLVVPATTVGAKTTGLIIDGADVTVSDVELSNPGTISDDSYQGIVDIREGGATLDGVKITNPANKASAVVVKSGFGAGETVTIANSDISVKSRAIYIVDGANGTVNIENTDVTGVYTINVNSASSQDLVLNVTDCGLHGWTSYGNIASATFTNTEFSKGGSDYDYLRPYADTTLENCTFDEEFLMGAGQGGFTITINGCTKNGVAITAENVQSLLLDSEDAAALLGCTIVVDGVTVELNYYTVTVVGGTLVAGGTTSAPLAEGATVEITAPETDASGKVFAYWALGGVSVSTDRSYTVTVGTSNATYTAVYRAVVVETPGTAAELAALLQTAADSMSLSVTINLDKDFDLTGWETFAPSTYNGTNLVTINGNGHKLTGLTTPFVGGCFGGYAGGYIINDLTIEGANINRAGFNSLGLGAFVVYMDSVSGLEFHNCHLVDSTVICTDSYAGGFVGYSTAENLIVEDCSVTNSTIQGTSSTGAIIGHNQCDNQTVSFTNTTIEDVDVISTSASSWRVGFIAGTFNGNGTITVSNVTVSGGSLTQEGQSPEEGQSNLYGRLLGPTIVEAAAPAVATSEELATIITGEETDVEVELAAGTFTLPSFNSTNPEKNITITGTEDTVIDLTTSVTESNCTLTLEGVTVDFGHGSYIGLQHIDGVTYRDCTLRGTQFLYADATFENCTFIHSADYCVWTYAANNVTFTDCTFTTGGKAILVYNEVVNANFEANITLTNCTFTDDNTVTSPKAVVETGTNADNTATSNRYNITIDNCTVTGFNTNNSTSVLFGNKNSMDTEHLNVVIDGVDVY